jgi:malate dehydrogenase (oxaloacetate-decarboxylating)(NADP+)
MLTADMVSSFNIKPRIAMLSYSNFGSTPSAEAAIVRNAVARIKEDNPDMVIDGEVQAGVAFNKDLLKENYPFSDLVNGAPNVLIFPNLAAGNIAYHLLQEVGSAEAVGPILLGLKKPVYVLQLGSTVRQIVNMIALAVVEATVKEGA